MQKLIATLLFTTIQNCSIDRRICRKIDIFVFSIFNILFFYVFMRMNRCIVNHYIQWPLRNWDNVLPLFLSLCIGHFFSLSIFFFVYAYCNQACTQYRHRICSLNLSFYIFYYITIVEQTSMVNFNYIWNCAIKAHN